MSEMTAASHSPSWLRLASRLLLLMGVAQLIAGIIFFFAFNWDAMGKWQKFGVLEVALIVLLIAARWRGLDDLIGQLLLMGAAALAGVSLAVYGQIYQTGADTYQLFVGWAVIVAGWVFVARFVGLWIGWFALINVAAALYLAEFAWRWDLEFQDIAVALAILNAATLVLRELAAVRLSWARPLWSRWILSAAFLFLTSVGVIATITDSHRIILSHWLFGLAFYAVTIGASYAWYRMRAKDIAVLTLIALSLAAVASFIAFRLLERSPAGNSEQTVFFVMAVAVLLSFGGAGLWVSRERRQLLQSGAQA